jgi:hypothetical protein
LKERLHMLPKNVILEGSRLESLVKQALGY